METLGLYEPEELTLFGGELLMGLGSPLEPDQVYVYPTDGVEGTGVVEPLGKDSISDVDKLNLYTSINSSPTIVTQENASCLDLNWLDTKLDLNNLLQDDSDVYNLIGQNVVEVPVHFDDSIDVSDLSSSLMPSPSNTGSLEAQPISAEDLFHQICSTTIETETTEAKEVVTETTDNLLTEVFKKLSSEIQIIVDNDTISVPDFGQEAASPMSTDDIESLLSGPVSPAVSEQPASSTEISPSSSSSCLESLLTSNVNSPSETVSLDCSFDSDVSEVGPSRSNKSRRRSRPYDGPRLDRKERKKMQNKTAALKYRQKKKEESESREEFCAKLEARNKELRDKVESITREIHYLKDLMSEVLKAKGIDS